MAAVTDLQIFTKAFTITTTMDAVTTAGRAKESAYALTMKGKELKNDMEFAIFDWSAGATGGAGSTTKARMMTSLHHWLINVTGSTGYSGVSAVTITGNMTGATIAEGTFNLILQNMYDQGAKPNAVYVKGPLKRLITGWGTSTSRVWDGSKKITNAVDIYESDFGVLEMKLERYAASSIGYILDESKWKKAVLTPVKQKPLGSRGLGDDYLLYTEWTLEARNPTGSGLFISAG